MNKIKRAVGVKVTFSSAGVIMFNENSFSVDAVEEFMHPHNESNDQLHYVLLHIPCTEDPTVVRTQWETRLLTDTSV